MGTRGAYTKENSQQWQPWWVKTFMCLALCVPKLPSLIRQAVNEVGIPVFIWQEKRLRLGEVKEHAPDHLPEMQTPEVALWGKAKLLWVRLIHLFASTTQQGLCTGAIPDWLTVTASIHLTEISSRPGSGFHTGWSELLAPVLSLLVIPLNANIPPFGLFSFYLPHLPPHSAQTLMLDSCIPEYPETTNIA